MALAIRREIVSVVAKNVSPEIVDVGLVSQTEVDGRPVLSFDTEQHHADGLRARALVFHDPRSRAILPLIDRIAPSTANVLVVGETGTGKELVARYVHALSERADKPFLAVNCGAFSEALVEGELFGHERGAFTGAVAARVDPLRDQAAGLPSPCADRRRIGYCVCSSRRSQQ